VLERASRKILMSKYTKQRQIAPKILVLGQSRLTPVWHVQLVAVVSRQALHRKRQLTAEGSFSVD
jgi:hypothetical protein